jgi:nicotinamide-nucleotide amidase
MTTDVALLTVGDELLNGSLLDSNSAVIAVALRKIGLAVTERRSVGDDHMRIANALRELADGFAVVIVTGGLGTTSDDLTAAACAEAFSLPLLLHPDALAMVESHFARRKRTMHPDNRRSALMPQGSIPQPNPIGVAPGIHLRHKSCDLFLLPGVPAEMQALLTGSILPQLQTRFDLPPLLPERILSIFGHSEPEVETALTALTFPANISVAFAVDFPLVNLKLRTADASAKRQLAAITDQVAALFGSQVIARDGASVAATTAAMLTAAGKTLALAESCTGGLIAAQLTDIPGASAFLERSAVTYANRAKSDWLQVSDRILEADGAVSAACARAMAEGIRQVAGSDFGLAVTGIAGPDGGTPEKPVGTVFIALALDDDTIVQVHHFNGQRNQIRQRSAVAALALLQQNLQPDDVDAG